MDDDEELKNQCFGGDYSGEVKVEIDSNGKPAID